MRARFLMEQKRGPGGGGDCCFRVLEIRCSRRVLEDLRETVRCHGEKVFASSKSNEHELGMERITDLTDRVTGRR